MGHGMQTCMCAHTHIEAHTHNKSTFKKTFFKKLTKLYIYGIQYDVLKYHGM